MKQKIWYNKIATIQLMVSRRFCLYYYHVKNGAMRCFGYVIRLDHLIEALQPCGAIFVLIGSHHKQ